MKRLTTKNEHRQWEFGEYMPNWEAICAMTGRGTQDYTFALKAALDKLGQYEDTDLSPEDILYFREYKQLYTNGLSVTVPCSVGDMVWCVRGTKRHKGVYERKVDSITILAGGAFILHTTCDDVLGVTAFLSKEAAQQKAEQLNRKKE